MVIPRKYKDGHARTDCVDGFIQVIKETYMMHNVPVEAIVGPEH